MPIDDHDLSQPDVLIVGAGHNGLVAAATSPRRGGES